MIVSVRKLVDIALVACIAYPSAQCAFGQTIRPAQPGQVQPNVQPGNVQPGADRTFAPGNRADNRILQGSTIIGSNVMLQGGVSFGTLRDFVISDSGCLEYAVINADNGLVAVPWGAGMFDFGRRAFMLDFGRDRVRELPHIRDIAELRNPQIQQRVQTFYRGGDHGDRAMRGNNANPRGAENQPREAQPQNRGTVRGATPSPRPEGGERPAAGERREK